jgi:NADH dehydrogenase FAD-containing subunit
MILFQSRNSKATKDFFHCSKIKIKTGSTVDEAKPENFKTTKSQQVIHY